MVDLYQGPMNFFLVLGIALALAMDAFAVSIGISASLKGVTKIQMFRSAIAFGLFQFLMPIIGWSAGNSIQRYIEAFDHWIGFGLLLFIGSRMIYNAFKKEDESRQHNSDPTKGSSLFLLALATSIDALAVGLSLAVLQVAILYPAVIIGIVAFLMTIIGSRIGPLLGRFFGKRAELFGGVILIAIGIKILIEHL